MLAQQQQRPSASTVVAPGGRIPFAEHTGVHRLHLQAAETLGNNDLRQMMKLPWGVGRNEWIAGRTVVLFEELVRMVNVIEDTCTPETCPRMSAGRQLTYEWPDEQTGETRQLPAIDYMRNLVEYAHVVLSDGKTLPLEGGPFPDHFMHAMKTLHRRFFRVYAHTYIHHFSDVCAHQGEKHLNFCFKHWLFFVREFDLVSDSDLLPLSQLVQKFEAHADATETPLDRDLSAGPQLQQAAS